MGCFEISEVQKKFSSNNSYVYIWSNFGEDFGKYNIWFDFENYTYGVNQILNYYLCFKKLYIPISQQIFFEILCGKMLRILGVQDLPGNQIFDVYM